MVVLQLRNPDISYSYKMFGPKLTANNFVTQTRNHDPSSRCALRQRFAFHISPRKSHPDVVIGFLPARFPTSEWNVTLSLENTIKHTSKCRAISFHKFFGARSVPSCMDVLVVNCSKSEPDSHHWAELGVCSDLWAPAMFLSVYCISSSSPVGGPRLPLVRKLMALIMF